MKRAAKKKRRLDKRRVYKPSAHAFTPKPWRSQELGQTRIRTQRIPSWIFTVKRLRGLLKMNRAKRMRITNGFFDMLTERSPLMERINNAVALHTK